MVQKLIDFRGTYLMVEFTIDLAEEYPICFERIRLVDGEYRPFGGDLLPLLNEMYEQVSETEVVAALTSITYELTKELNIGSSGTSEPCPAV